MSGKILPSVQPVPAGSIANASQLNAVAYACSFLLDKPIALVYDSAGSQALSTSLNGTVISFGSAYYNTDGMWSSGSPTKLTIQTPGYYKVSYGIHTQGGTLPTSLGGCVEEVTGASNPLGSSVTVGPYWGSFTVPGATVTAYCSNCGMWPFYLWPGDTLKILGYTATTSESTTSVTQPSYFSAEWMSA
jgi:hypothetical protein